MGLTFENLMLQNALYLQGDLFMSSNILGLFWERKTNLLTKFRTIKAKQTAQKSFSLNLSQEFSCKYYNREKDVTTIISFLRSLRRNGLLSIALSIQLG